MAVTLFSEDVITNANNQNSDLGPGMIHILETQRLKLRKLNLNDAAFIINLFNSPGWLQFIGDRMVRTEEQAITYLRDGPIKSYLENGFGLYLVEIKDTGVPVGMCGILKRDTLKNPDIGFALLPEHPERAMRAKVQKPR